MASKKNTAEKTATPTVAAKPNPRVGKPAYLRPQPQCSWIRLQPKSRTHAPVKAWAYRTADGWSGWLEQFRTVQVKKTNWSREMWDEVDESDGTLSGQVEVTPVAVSVNTRLPKGRGKAK